MISNSHISSYFFTSISIISVIPSEIYYKYFILQKKVNSNKIYINLYILYLSIQKKR
ncbi:hypothetical protein HMPREF1984_01027 [Leptotrichia sp. oral taxon 215 str. W9775]|nr:hypothetical protein HMPREF1984_01027 [Leptotrichia sp. oral taxon 215 str. W9775]